jgi:hypothetical protein
MKRLFESERVSMPASDFRGTDQPLRSLPFLCVHVCVFCACVRACLCICVRVDYACTLAAQTRKRGLEARAAHDYEHGLCSQDDD